MRRATNVTRFNSTFYAYVSRNAHTMETDNARSQLRRTYVARSRAEVSRWFRVVTRYVAKLQAPIYAEVGELSNHKRTGDSDD